MKAYSQVETDLPDLAGVSFETLGSYSDADLQPASGKLLRRVDRPGASLSGYSGAGGLSGDVRADILGRLG